MKTLAILSLSLFAASGAPALDLLNDYPEPWRGIAGAQGPHLREAESQPGLLAPAEEFSGLGGQYRNQIPPVSFWRMLWMKIDHDLAFSPSPKRGEIFYFFFTVYYTPMEAGFKKRLGFDVTPVAKAGKRFPLSFTTAVRCEGFGTMKKPVGKLPYLKYDGTWGFRSRQLGNRNNTLVPRRSAAVHRRNPLFRKGLPIFLLDHRLHNEFGTIEFRAADTGGGLHRAQIDLFWGVDVPWGPGRDVFRPAGTDYKVEWMAPVWLER